MRRIPAILVTLLWCGAVAALSVTAQQYQRETDSIPVFVDGELVREPWAGGIKAPRAVLADIDGDGDLDLLVGDHDGSVHFYRNAGTASESSYVPEPAVLSEIGVGSRAAPTVVDIDSDGDLDMFVGDAVGGVSYYRNNGTSRDPAFGLVSATYQGITAGPSSFPSFADVDDDGDYDLFIGTGAHIWPVHLGGTVHWYENAGTPESPEFILVTDHLTDIDVDIENSRPVFADIDGDNDLDLLVGSGGGSIEFYRNLGTATAHDYVLETKEFAGIVLGYGGQVELGDIDGDGDLDLFVTERLGNIRFYRNVGTATSCRFELAAESFGYRLNDVGALSAPAFGDIDADGDFDLLVGARYARLCFYRNTGTAIDPVFTLETRDYGGFFAGHDPDVVGFTIPALVDIDGDGDLDLFVGLGTGELLFYRNTGTASEPRFERSTDMPRIACGSHLSPAFADIDGDADYDLLVRYVDGFAFYLNAGTATDPQFELVPGAFPQLRLSSLNQARFADVDDDGDLDLLVGKGNNRPLYLSGGTLALYRNTGSAEEPTFALETASFEGVHVPSHACPAFVDIDADGDLDVFVGELDGGLYFYRNTG